MHFAPDAEDTLEFTVALCNTHPAASRSGHDELAELEQLAVLLEENSYSGRIDNTMEELVEVVESRERLRRVWRMHRDDAVDEVNAILRDANAVPQLTRHHHMDWHLHATPANDPLAQRILVEVALAIVDVIRSNEMNRMRVCEAEDCEGLLLDLSRNGSKRFCSIRCGNRMNQIAYRERNA